MAAGSRTGELQRFVPRIATAWDEVAPGRSWQALDGSLCFVDISGFTSLSERMARHGRSGAEELTDILNRVFGGMLGTAYGYGGSLLKFGGDALLLLFDGESHPVRAASAVVEMQRGLRRDTAEPGRAGRVRLRMSAGIHSGEIHLFCVGTSHRELLVTGPAGTMTTRMEQTAQAGEIVVSRQTAQRLPAGAVGAAAGQGRLLRWRTAAVPPSAVEPRMERGVDQVERWIPVALRRYLTATTPEAEHRMATVGFIRFCGVDAFMAAEGPEAVAAALDTTMTSIQASVDAEGVTFLATDINEDGGKVILVAGAPAVHEDDEGRMLRAARRIATATTPFELHIGINRGHVFAGEVGTAYRSSYTVMGDTVNVAARLCAAAWAGRVLVTPDVLDRSHTMYVTEPLPPLLVKGKSEPLTTYELGDEIGLRPAATRTDLPFVGRGPELATLRETLGRIGGGEPVVVTVVGDAGIGKSRLVEEAMSGVSGLTVVSVRAEPYGTATPYRPLRDPIRDLLGITQGSAGAMGRQAAARLGALDPGQLPYLPLLADAASVDVPDTEEAADIEPRFRRDRLADVVIAVMRRTLPPASVLLVEDAQWMDEASAHLLSRIAIATATEPWAVVVTRRGGDEGFLPADGTFVTLGPLGATEATQVVIEGTAAAPLPPHEVAVVAERSGGNPLFLEETLRVVRETGSVGALPDSLGGVIGVRIDALPPVAGRILRYASVLGRSFRTDTLRRLLAGEHLEFDAAHRRMLDGFLEGDGAARLRFRQSMARDVAYEGLSFSRRRELHLLAADVVTHQANGRTEDVADLLSTHYALGGDHASTWTYARIAGANAKAAFANVEAATAFERALEAARRLDDIPSADRAAVWVDLGDARGPLGRFDDALDAYRRAAQLLTDDPVALADLRYKRAAAKERAGSYHAALREITAGIRILEGIETPEAAATLARLAVRRAFVRQAQDQPAAALAMAEEAVAKAKLAGEHHAEGLACLVLHWAHLMLGIPGGATFGERALHIFTDLDELDSVSAATNLLGADAFYTGRWDDAVAFYRQGEEAARRAGNLLNAALIMANIGEVLVNQGRLDEAEPLLDEAIRVQRGFGWLEGANGAERHLGRLLIGRGDHAAAEKLLRRVRDDYAAAGRPGYVREVSLYLAQSLIRSGRPAEAAAVVEQVTAGTSGSFAGHDVLAALVRTELAVAAADLDAALAAATAGIETATAHGLDYERALLMAAVADVQRRRGGDADETAAAEAAAVFTRLGVRSVAALTLSSAG